MQSLFVPPLGVGKPHRRPPAHRGMERKATVTSGFGSSDFGASDQLRKVLVLTDRSGSSHITLNEFPYRVKGAIEVQRDSRSEAGL